MDSPEIITSPSRRPAESRLQRNLEREAARPAGIGMRCVGGFSCRAQVSGPFPEGEPRDTSTASILQCIA